MRPLGFCFTRFSIFNTVPSPSTLPLSLANFSTSHVVRTRKQSGKSNFSKRTQMAIPAHKLFVWQDVETKATPSDRFLQFAVEVASMDGLNKKRLFLKRPYDDQFSKMKARMETKLKGFLPAEIQIRLLCLNGHTLPADDVSLYDLFFGESGKRCEALEIAESRYAVVRDPAWLDNRSMWFILEIAVLPLVGCPVFPSCDWRNASVTDNIQFLWFIAPDKKPLNIQFDEDATTSRRIKLDGWHHVHTGPYYSPTDSDLGNYLAVLVDSGGGAIAEGAVSSTPVGRADDPENGEEFLFAERQEKYCKEYLTGDSYRIMSYNILADLYLNLRKAEQLDLFFPYCPKEFQEPRYRYPVLLRELEGYRADLMFLQEVDFRMQKRFLVPFLNLKNYTTIFNCKMNEVNEGLALAFSNERFRVMEDGNYSIKLSTFLEDPSNADIVEYLSSKELISNIVSSRPTILQLVHLQTKNGDQNLLCANTHLYFDPAHDEVKLIQTLLCLRYISMIRNKLSDNFIRVLFAGDLNSHPDSQSVSLILGDEIRLRAEKEQQNEMDLTIRAPFPCQCLTGFPDYTNFTHAEGVNVGFVGCLDYIWANPPLRLHRNVPMPDHNLVTKHGALPSKTAPSDHLPIICEVGLSDPE